MPRCLSVMLNVRLGSCGLDLLSDAFDLDGVA